MDLFHVIKLATQTLSDSSDTAKLDAEVLLCHVLKKDRSYLISWPEKEIDSTQLKQFQKLIEQRHHGHPVAHLVQQKEFWSLNLIVSPDTLIPRPETELIVERILDIYENPRNTSLLDLGTGSGAIALAIASEKPEWNLTATDQSQKALQIAERNAQQLRLNNIEFKSGCWFEAISSQRFDIIVSNPPYIPESDPHLSQGDVRFEPETALASGNDGLNDIRLITKQAPQYLKPNGMLFIEHGYDQKKAVREIFEQNSFKSIIQIQDLAGQPRITSGVSP